MRTRDWSQHNNTDNPEYVNEAPGTRVKWRPIFHTMRWGSETLIVGGHWEPFDPEAVYGQKEELPPLDPSEIVWPFERYPVDEDGRGLAQTDLAYFFALVALLCLNARAEHLTTDQRIAA